MPWVFLELRAWQTLTFPAWPRVHHRSGSFPGCQAPFPVFLVQTCIPRMASSPQVEMARFLSGAHTRVLLLGETLGDILVVLRGLAGIVPNPLVTCSFLGSVPGPAPFLETSQENPRASQHRSVSICRQLSKAWGWNSLYPFISVSPSIQGLLAPFFEENWALFFCYNLYLRCLMELGW